MTGLNKDDILNLKNKLENLEEKLDSQIKELEAREDKWNRMEDKVNVLLEKDKDIILFNVNGKKFSIEKKTLLKKDNLLSKLVLSDINLNEEIYIDRISKYFPFILEFIRHNRINYKRFSKDELRELLEECKYYEVEEIINNIEEMNKDISFIKLEFNEPYIYNNAQAGTNKLADLSNKNLNTGVCTNSPGWIILELNSVWEFNEIEIGGWTGNSNLWYSENGANSKILTSEDKKTWKQVGTIPSGYGSNIKTITLNKSMCKYIKFESQSYLGIGYLKINKIK